MRREIIQSLLSLTGVGGIMLANRRNRPYFYGIESVLERAKQMLAQGVIQVIDNIPDNFDSFVFQFHQNAVYLYRLGQGTILIILTTPELQISEYQQVIAKVRQSFANDPYNTIGVLKQLLGSTSLPAGPPPTPAPRPTLADILRQLNHLSQFTTQYLGKVVVTNYWKAARPQSIWLSEFEIDRNATISHSHAQTLECTPEQHQQIKDWANSYIKRCKQVIRNFDDIIKQENAQNDKLNLIL